MGPFRFAASSSNLESSSTSGEMFGYLSLPAQAHSARQGVVLCSPLGQEAVRSHRMYRVLSERLARAGVACLRFDYFGSGDSDGDDDDLTLESCVENTLSADRALRRLAGCAHVSWVGLRFGGFVAALSTMKAVHKPDRLFLWDPIEEGESWIKQLKREHRHAVQMLIMSRPALPMPIPTESSPRLDRPSQLMLNTNDSAERFESQGFIVSEALHEGLKSISLGQYSDLRCGRLIVLAAGPEQHQKFSVLENARHILSFDLHQVEPAHWNNDEAISSAIVANDVIALVTREMAGGGQ
jgi:uncharacterized protein